MPTFTLEILGGSCTAHLQIYRIKSESLSSHFHHKVVSLISFFAPENVAHLVAWFVPIPGWWLVWLPTGRLAAPWTTRFLRLCNFRKAERQGTARLHPLSCWMSKHEPCSTQTLEWNDASFTNSLTNRKEVYCSIDCCDITSCYIVHSQAPNFPLRCNCF